MKQQTLLLVLLLCIIHSSTAQKKRFYLTDSLSQKSFEYLDNRIFALKKDSAKAAVYLNTYLQKTKKEQNWEEVMYGFKNILHFSPFKLKLVYADSMLYAAKKTNQNDVIGSAYLSKGIVFYGQKSYELAFDNYSIANDFISRTRDDYLSFKVKYHMAQIKYYLGFYNEAIALFEPCLDYFQKDDQEAYLNTIHALGLCYNRIGNYGVCTEFNTKGITESNRINNSSMLPYFVHSEGINEYYKKNFARAIQKLELALTAIHEKKDFANESVAYFYIGKSYWEMDKKEKALSYFLKVDQIFQDKNYLRPDLREVYELLIAYYKSKQDLKKQLHYIEKLLKADAVLKETYKYLIKNIHKKYDTKALLVEKEQIKKELAWKTQFDFIFIGIILALLFISLWLTYRHFKNKSFYKKKFTELMMQSANKNQIKQKANNKEHFILDIPQDTINLVVKELEKFEKEKKFLAKDVRLHTLAASFNTNPKYLSKIISRFKEKGIVEYTNDLKIEYIITLLKEDKKTQNYTNAALAEEAGFTSTQRFVNAFKARTKMPTAEFIRLLRKE